MLSDALDAYAGRHLDLAEDVRTCATARWSQMYNALFREFLNSHDGRPATDFGVHAPALHHQHYERMGDHATTIAEQVIYLITGELPDDTRPKAESVADLTAVSNVEAGK